MKDRYKEEKLHTSHHFVILLILSLLIFLLDPLTRGTTNFGTTTLPHNPQLQSNQTALRHLPMT
jgi:hypothetical protein